MVFSPPGPHAVPRVDGELDPGKHALSSFEAYLLSLVDGASDVDTLGQIGGLATIEAQAMIHSLVARGVLRVTGAAPPPPPVEEVPAERAVLGRMPTTRFASFRAPPAPAAVELTPLDRAVSLEKQGEFKAAIEVLEKALERAPDPAPLCNRLALVLLRDRRDYPRAESLLRRALQLEPANGLYRQNLSKVLELAARRARGQ